MPTWGDPKGIAMDLIERLFVGLAVASGMALFAAFWMIGW